MSDHYVYNALAINPAYAGSEEALSIMVFYRNSWVGIEGSPNTTALSIHAPLNNERMGLGFFMMNDNIGISKETSFVGNYAYRMDLGYGKLAFGLGFGFIYCNTAWNKLAAQDVDDALLADNSSTGVMPDFSIGIYYSTKKYFMGISMPLFLSHEYDAAKDKYIIRNDFKEYNYFYNAGYNFEINPDIQFFPSLLVKYHNGDGIQFDINSQLILRNRIWLGASYRSKNVLVGMLQCQINNQLRIAYSYDFMIGNDALYKYNAHEIMLNYVFKYKTEVVGPRQF
jgi:type IX secretion system PorP/SprF family membrane protein